MIVGSSKQLALFLAVIGSGLIVYGFVYSLQHLDNALSQQPSTLQQYSIPVGFMVLLLAPLVLKRLVLFFVLLALGAAFYFWITSP
jgi:hypothetical protein